MPKLHFTPDDHHQFRLYDGMNIEGAKRLNDITDFDAGKRTVIVLPGTRVTHEVPQPVINVKFVPAYRNLIKESLDRQGITDAQIYCGVYGHNDEQMISDHYSHPLRKGSEPHARPFTTPAAGTDVRHFVRDVLVPFAGITTGTHPSTEEVTENLSRLTLVAHSFGGTFAAEAAREFQFVLRKEHDYSREEAERIVSEVVVVGIAPVRDLAHARPDFRNIDFAGRADASNMSFMHRVAHDHIDDGFAAAGTDATALAEYYYQRSGYPHLPGSPAQASAPPLDAPVQTGRHGQLIRASMPDAIHWQSNSGKPRVMDQGQLDSEHAMLESAVRKLRGMPEDSAINGLNGETLIRAGLVPAHDHRMYLQPAEENRELVAAVDQVLAASVTRAPQERAQDPLQTVTALANRPLLPAPHIIAATHEHRDMLAAQPAQISAPVAGN